MSLTIVLADDHGIVCDGLRLLLESQQRFEVVCSASNGIDAVRCIEEYQPDLAVLDIAMPEMDGIVAAEQALNRSPDTAIIILSMYGDCTHVFRALRSGVRGYVLKESVATDLIAAIDTVMAGHRYLSRRLTDMLVDDFVAGSNGDAGAPARTVQLSPREREILQFVAEGHSSANIGRQLGLATSTVDTYRSRMMQKLEISSSAGLVKYAIRLGLTNA